MAVAHLSDEEMEAFREGLKRDPASARLRELEVEHVTQAGGVALQVWRLYQGVVFGEPVMMTPDEVGKRLDLPEETVEEIIASVNAAVRPAWRETPEWKRSVFATKERTGRWD